MKTFLHSLSLLTLMLVASMSANAAVTITKQGGWFEAAYVEWGLEANATYDVYVSPAEKENWTKLDNELVRKYPTCGRADVVGLKAGNYKLKVVSSAGSEAVTEVLSVKAHDRSGFAHVGMPGGIGAYKNDGTLKDGAKVLYVHAGNAKTVSTVVKTGSKDSNLTECVGLQTIIDAYQKGYDSTPLDIRLIGTLKVGDLDHISSSAEGLQIKGKSDYSEMPITIEGIGEDATISGFGILLRGAKDVEIRNFAIMLCMDDCLSLDTKNANIWIHHMDFFYGNTGGDADQAKGDGTVDIKASSKNVTVSYNHFYDSGKCSLGGMSNETTSAWHTYHHNWFDHSDSRHPRIRVQFFHVYNNYYDGVSKYGVGAAQGGTAFVEANYFRNTKYPMLSSKQGTDAEGDGTFSGEPGGVIKAYRNILVNERKIQYYTEGQTDGKWDAVLVEDRNATINAVAFSGGTSYNNEADLAARTTYIENKMDAPEDVPAIVKANAGRMNGGDITWTMSNENQDENYSVITDLKGALQSYKSTLVGLADGTTIPNGGAVERIDAGDGKGIDPVVNDSYVPTWAGGGGSVVTGKPVIGSEDDFFWFNKTNEAAVNAYYANNTFDGGDFKPEQVIKGSDGTMYSDYTGSVRIAENGAMTFFYDKGIVRLDAYVSATGSMKWQVSVSNDGKSFTDKGGDITGNKGTHPKVSYSGEAVKYVRIKNLASGNRDIQGIKLFEEGESEPDTRLMSDLTLNESEKTLNIGETFNVTYTSSSTGAVAYRSSQNGIATIDATGKVTAVKEGSVEITVTQTADDNYKKGEATVMVTVVDPRAESALEVTSDQNVSVKEGETSQIVIAGAAGTVTYVSGNPSVATVNADGLITAVEAGTAIITITDPGSTTTKGGSTTVKVTVTRDMTGVEVCYFTASTKSPSNSMVSVTGSYSNSKGSVEYGGTTYTDCVKMESSTSIKVTPVADCKITLVFGPSEVSKKVNVGGTTMTTDSKAQVSFDGTAGTTIEIKKGDSINLFLIVFEPQSTGISSVTTVAKNTNVMYDLMGRRVAKPVKGQIITVNGKKFIAK